VAGGYGATAVSVLTLLASWTVIAPARAQDAAPPPAEVRVVHYNLRNYLAMPRRIAGEIREGAPKPDREKAPLVKIVAGANPDIVAVCEMGTQADLEDLQKRLESAGAGLSHRALVSAADTERHLAVLSRFPIDNGSKTTLTYRIDSKELPFQRGILDTTVRITPDYTLRLIAVHLKSRREVPEGDQAAMRRNEAVLLRGHIDSILAANPAENILLCGDFNDTRNEAVIKTVQGDFGTKSYLRDVILTDSDGLRWTYYWSTADVYERIDFAFASPGLFPEILRDRSSIVSHKSWLDASDHRPIVIAIRPVETRNRR
jgi:endonuclease/exonuclease/phosphatase family metal-dependent hydrolase